MRSNSRSRSGPRLAQFRCVRMARSSHPLVSVDMRPFRNLIADARSASAQAGSFSINTGECRLRPVLRRVNDILKVYIGTVISTASLVAMKKPLRCANAKKPPDATGPSTLDAVGESRFLNSLRESLTKAVPLTDPEKPAALG